MKFADRIKKIRELNEKQAQNIIKTLQEKVKIATPIQDALNKMLMQKENSEAIRDFFGKDMQFEIVQTSDRDIAIINNYGSKLLGHDLKDHYYTEIRNSEGEIEHNRPLVFFKMSPNISFYGKQISISEQESKEYVLSNDGKSLKPGDEYDTLKIETISPDINEVIDSVVTAIQENIVCFIEKYSPEVEIAVLRGMQK